MNVNITLKNRLGCPIEDRVVGCENPDALSDNIKRVLLNLVNESVLEPGDSIVIEEVV